MRIPEIELITILKKNRVDFVSTLPCEKIKGLLELIPQYFNHIPLTREEEGAGISAGIALAGKTPAMFVQSSGIGNMINALLSLTGFYEFPLALFVSQRGIYKEKIAAQMPMGQHLSGILKGAGIPYSIISTIDDFRVIEKKLPGVYRNGKIHAFLLSPAIFEKTGGPGIPVSTSYPITGSLKGYQFKKMKPRYTRFEILKTIEPYLDCRVVVCNQGFPSKELLSIRHQPSNFYMLGSMGMATPIALGISLASDKEVIVIDGDGSLLMNPGSLATVSHFAPMNLTVFAIDNTSYGSTGDQPTLTGSCVDLALVAKGFGIKNVIKAASTKQLTDAFKRPQKELKFIHALAVPGNQDVPPIPLHHLEVKKQVMEFIKKQGPRD
jgi:sulfopyruvate decarboxylase beta subunit